jgi:Holliday junction DNA helicase RuvA
LISWISGDLLELWQANNKFFILINCQGLGYEIQIIEPLFVKLQTNQSTNKNIILWIKHIKKEESDLLFGFESKDQKKFFIEVISIRGIGSQIGISILNRLSIPQIINAAKTQNKKEISSIPGIGQKMTERLILELNNKFKKEIEIKDKKNKDDFEIINPEISQMLDDLQLTLHSLNYTKNEIKRILPIIIKETYSDTTKNRNTSFEDLLKLAMNYLENDSSNLVI